MNRRDFFKAITAGVVGTALLLQVPLEFAAEPLRITGLDATKFLDGNLDEIVGGVVGQYLVVGSKTSHVTLRNNRAPEHGGRPIYLYDERDVVIEKGDGRILMCLP